MSAVAPHAARWLVHPVVVSVTLLGLAAAGFALTGGTSVALWLVMALAAGFAISGSV